MALRSAREKAPLEEILFWLLAADLRACADGELCRDENVAQYATLLQMETSALIMRQLSAALQKPLDDSTFLTNVMRKAVAWDLAHPQTNSPVWFCNSGHAVSSAETYPAKEWDKRRRDFKKEYTLSAYQPHGLNSPY